MRSKTSSAVIDVIASLSERSAADIREAHTLRGELGMDRIAVLQLTTELAERFDVDVEAKHVRRFRTVGDVIAYFAGVKP